MNARLLTLIAVIAAVVFAWAGWRGARVAEPDSDPAGSAPTFAPSPTAAVVQEAALEPGNPEQLTAPSADPGRTTATAAAPVTRSETAAAPGPSSPQWRPVRRARVAASARLQERPPEVTTELAFLALRYVGVDPRAERSWRRAIDDPATPPGLRADLIEDLNEQGYHDNSHPTAEDLQLIRARLALIERLAPHAMDEVNRSAFEEAYKDLLNMYVRLGGDPGDL